MNLKQTDKTFKLAVKHYKRSQSSNLSPPKSLMSKNKQMRRCPELFLAGCTSAEPASASFRQNKCNKIQQQK